MAGSWSSSDRVIGRTTRLGSFVAHVVATLRTPRAEQGTTAIEYALLGSLVAVVIVAALITIGGKLTDVFDTVAGAF